MRLKMYPIFKISLNKYILPWILRLLNMTTAIQQLPRRKISFIICLLFFFVSGCNQQPKQEVTNTDQKVGVLLVNHGSRSATWRQALLDLEKNVQNAILEKGIVKGIKTAHMEYTEPSIATQLKAFDADGYTDIIIVPVFLTVSPHTFDDIPTIIGQKQDPQSMEVLKIEKIERYTPKAKTYLTPNLDFTDILKKNVLQRVKAISKSEKDEGLVLIGYGDETYDKEWGALFDEVAGYVKENSAITDHSYGWCGHIVHYNSDSTTTAINRVLKKKQTAVVIPVLVAHDEYFQIKIIGDGIAKVNRFEERVIYKPDSILPDFNVENWVIQVCQEYAGKIASGTLASR